MTLTQRHPVPGVGEVDEDRGGALSIELKAGGCLFAATYATTNQTHGAKSIASRHAVVMELVREPFRTLEPRVGTLVRVVRISGVGLRESDDAAVMIADADGSRTVHGSVLRGVADAQLVEADPARHTLQVGISDAEAGDAGLVCGGRATLLLSPLADLPAETFAWFTAAEPVVIATPADGSGADLVVSPHGVAGSLDAAVNDDAAATIAHRIIRGGASVAEIHEVDGVDVLFNAAIPTTRTMIVGGGPMADAFAAQGQLMGWEVSQTDTAQPAIDFCADANPADALLVLSHDPDVDTPALAAALVSEVGYIGAMGSRHTQTARAERLEALGHTDRSRIHGPVGLDLGSRSPAETAVAMAAEFLAVRRGRPPASLSSHTGPIHA